MIRRIVERCLDLLFPPHDDQRITGTLPQESLFSFYTFRKNATGAYTALPYRESAVRAVIRANKHYHGQRATALLADILSTLLMDVYDEESLILGSRPLLILIPSSRTTLLSRGYNQVEAICKQLPATFFETFTYEPRVLKRTGRKSQAHVPHHERAKNIAGAFFVPENAKNKIAGKSVILVDDVTETGSTLHDATRALYEAGATTVVAMALAT